MSGAMSGTSGTIAAAGTMEDSPECPLCMETLELDDVYFYPCSCGYQICRFCWHRIRTDENGLCPACRKPYSENPAEYTPLSQEQIQKVRNSKRQKNQEKRQKVVDGRKHLAELRVVQRNLVFVIGLSPRLADPEMLKKQEYFGKFGRIHKIVVNNANVYPGPQGPSMGAYITYYKNEDAARAIQSVNDTYIDGRFLKASFGTTKYCSNFLKNQSCHKPDCMYLHEVGEEEASFTKEDMQMGKHQTFEMMALAQVSKESTNTRSRQKEQDLDVLQETPVIGTAVVSSSTSIVSSAGVSSMSVARGEGDSKQAGKKNCKQPQQDQGSADELERDRGMIQQHKQEVVDRHHTGLLHATVEREDNKQGNYGESVTVTGTNATNSSYQNSLPYGVACSVHPVQQLFSDMSQLSLQLNSGVLQQQIHHQEQKQQTLVRQESDEADDDDALLRDAVEAGQRSDSQVVERQELQNSVPLEQKTETGRLENEESGEVAGCLHSGLEDPRWSWQTTVDHLRRSHGNEDDLEFDPYGESAKALAMLMEAEKVRVIHSVRESLRQEEENLKEQRVPLWKRKGSFADGTDQTEAGASQIQTGVLHSETPFQSPFGTHLRPQHSVLMTSSGQAITSMHSQHAPLNGMWPMRHHKPGDGLLVQGTMGVSVLNADPIPVGRTFPDHQSPNLNSSSHMPGLPSQHYMWPEMGISADSSSQSTAIRRPTPFPGAQIPPFRHHTVYGLPPGAPSIGALPGSCFPPASDSQRPRHLANMNIPGQESVCVYPGPQQIPPYLQQTVQHHLSEPFSRFPGMHVPPLGAAHTTQPAGIRPPPGIHVKPEQASPVPYFVGGVPNPMDHSSGLVNGTLPHNS